MGICSAIPTHARSCEFDSSALKTRFDRCRIAELLVMLKAFVGEIKANKLELRDRLEISLLKFLKPI